VADTLDDLLVFGVSVTQQLKHRFLDEVSLRI
jgi:hypothetical protein